MTIFSVNQTVKIVNAGATYAKYTPMATELGLKNFHEGDHPVDGQTGRIVAVTKHPGWADENEKIMGQLFLGLDEHPDTGLELVAVEAGGTDYILRADGVELV